MKSTLRASHLALLPLLAGLGLTGWGLHQIGLPQQGVASNAFLWMLLMLLVAPPVLAGKLRPAGAAAALAVAFALLSGQFWPLLVTLWFVASAMVVGWWLLRMLGVREPAEQALICFLCGAGVLGTAAGLAAHFPVNYPGTYALALALPLGLGRRPLAYWAAASLGRLRGSGVNVVLQQQGWVAAAIAVAALVHFMVAFLPEVGPDALAVHLFLAADLRANHRWGFDAGLHVWAVMPLLVDWTYAIAYMLGGETAARLLNVAYIFSLAWLIRELVLWAGGTLLGAGWAVLLFLTMPLTFTESSTLFIEAGWSAWLVGGILYALRAMNGAAEKADLRLAGLLCGFALAAKAVTLSILPALLLVMLARPSAWLKAGRGLVLLQATLLGALTGSVPYLTAWRITGNPVFPFFNALFKSPLYPPINFEAPPFERYLSWDTLYRITFESPRYLEAVPGVAGFQWLLLLVPCAIALVALPRRRKAAAALLVIAIAAVACVFQQTAYLRYVFPAMVVLFAFIGVGLGPLLQALPGSVVWPTVMWAAALLNVTYFHTGTKYEDFPFQAAFSESARADFLTGRQAFRSIVAPLNELNVDRTPVLWVAKPLAAGVTADLLYVEWYNQKFMDEFMAVQSEQQMISLMAARGSEYAVVDMRLQNPPIALLLNVTDEVARRVHVSLRRIRPSLHFTRELLASPDFSEPSAWSLVPGARYDLAARAIEVSPQASAFQTVPVVPRRKYLNTISSRCVQPGIEGRQQINWSDASGNFLGVSSQGYRCTPSWARHVFEVTAPPGAVAATVYATGHFGGPVLVNLNSLKGGPSHAPAPG